MNIKVTKNNVTIQDADLIHSGEYKVNELNFVFSNDYNDLVTRAIFTKKNKSYEVTIANDKCNIPAEVLTENGDLEIGVYGFETSGDNLVLRYSPAPAKIRVIKGSYVSAEEGSTFLPADEFVTIADFNTSQGTQNTNISANTSAINGIKNGTTINSFAQVESALPKKTSDLTNDSGFITKNVDDLVNYYDKTAVDNKVSAVYKYKGSVATYQDLPSTSLTAGDVYNVESDGSNYAWTGTEWDKLGGTIDVSGFEEKSNKVTSLSSSSTDTQYPSAKCVYDIVGDIGSTLDTIQGEVI